MKLVRLKRGEEFLGIFIKTEKGYKQILLKDLKFNMNDINEEEIIIEDNGNIIKRECSYIG